MYASMTSAALATMALAQLAAAAPTTRQVSSEPAFPLFTLNITSVDVGGSYENKPLSACHTAAGQEAVCSDGSPPTPAAFALNQTGSTDGTGVLFFDLSTAGGSSFEQTVSFTASNNNPADLSYAFLNGGTTSVDRFSFDTDDSLLYQNSDVFHVCPEDVDYDNEKYLTLSHFRVGAVVPSDSGCEQVTVTKAPYQS